MSRKGITLAEAAVALLLLALPLAGLMDLGRGSSRSALADVERLAEDQLIADTLESVATLPVRTLKRMATDAAGLAWLMEKRVATCHADAKPAAARALERLRGALSIELEPRAGGHPELVRVRLVRGGKAVRARLFRVKRDALAEMTGKTKAPVVSN